MGQLQPPGDGQRSDHIRRRYDRAEHKSDAPWKPERIVRGGSDQNCREDHATDGEQPIGRRLALNSRQLIATPDE
jgi:hypothetical protein